MNAHLENQTEDCLAGVLNLCATIAQEDVDAVQRHDEAALALLDINDDDAMEALAAWIKCLEAWARPGGAQSEVELWPIMTQPCSAVLSKVKEYSAPAVDTPPSTGTPPLAAHKALTVILFRIMLFGDEVQGSPHRAPAPVAWAAGRAYLLTLSLPGAGAYGILHPALVGVALTNIRSWSRNSPVHRSGGVSEQSGSGDVAGADSGKRKGPQKRRRAVKSSAAGSDTESEGEDSEGEGAPRRRGQKAGTGVKARRGGGGGDGGANGEVLACLRLLKACVACGPLTSHQDLAVKLSEVLVGVSVVASVEGLAAMADLASDAMVELVVRAPVGDGAARGVVLQALMPVILMATGNADVPSRNKDCIKAHDHAVKVAKAIAAALKNATNQRLYETQSAANNNPAIVVGAEQGDAPDIPSENGGTPISAAGGDSSNSSPTSNDSTVSPTEDGGGRRRRTSAVVAVGERAGASPVLTMVQHLCVSAPERAEGRARVAGGIAVLLPELEAADRVRFVTFLRKFSRSARILHRGFAVELSSRLVTESWPWVNSYSVNGNSEDTAASPASSPETGDDGFSSPGFGDGGGKTMLALVVARAGDSAPTVRSKAASTLSDVLAGIQAGQAGSTREALRKAVLEACGWGEVGSFVESEGLLLDVVRARVQDEKANVRRNAVPALEALLALSPSLNGEGRGDGARGEPAVEHAGDFLLLEERCNDVSLATRKAAMTALSSLLMSRPEDEYLQSAWVRALLPLAGDPEQTCQNRLVELVRTVILDRVVSWHRAEVVAGTANGDRGKASAGRVMPAEGVPVMRGRVSSVWPLLAKAGHGDAHKCLKKAVLILMSQKDSGFKVAPLLKALRSAAVIALPPGVATEGDGEGDDADDMGEWGAEDMRLLSLAGNLPQSFLTTIRRGTWALLEAFLARAPSPGDDGKRDKSRPDVDPMFVVRCWNRIRGHILEEALSDEGGPADRDSLSPISEEAFESDGRKVLGVLAQLAWSVPAEVATPLAEDMLEMLLDLVARPETSAALVGALHMLCFAKAETEEQGATLCNAWANHALSSFEALLDIFVYQGSEALQDHAGARACGFDLARLVERLLFAVGEVVVVGFTSKEDAAGPSDPQVPGAKAAEATMVRPKASPQLIKLVQVLLPPRLPSSAHGVAEGEEGPATPSAVRALAFVTLGKLCLRDKGLAKSSVSILVRELDTAGDPAVRSNALVVLGDLCVRYTAMVDRHVGAMATCLQDSHPVVRRHAILLISQLLLQDYVKWRGLLLYRFLATLVDSDASVRTLGEFTLTRPLINKSHGLFAQNFVETLFVFNDYSEHPCYAAAAAGRADAGGGVTMEGIHLGGDSPAQVRKRMAVYSIMLEHMSDEHKITVTAKLAQEVLSAAVDGGLPIGTNSAASGVSSGKDGLELGGGKEARLAVTKKAAAVVKDALTVMASSGIRVGARGAAAGDVDDGSEEMGYQQSSSGGLAAAKSRLLSKVALKHLMETVVPVLTALKHVLERAHSPLLRELMCYFGELFRSHKEEVKGVLASDAGLVEEIDFDLRRFETEELERKAREASAVAAAAAAAASAMSMAPPRTPRGRRSIGGGGPPSGRRDSSAGPSIRAPRTPMAAVMQSARKTPFQNLGDCSAVRLKGSSMMVFSPALARAVEGNGPMSRGPRPRTPLHLRTPREAVAAALGNSPMVISPLPMRSMGDYGSSKDSNRGSGSGGADIELPSPDRLPPAKKRRWSVSVDLPPAEDSDKEEGDGSQAEGEAVSRPPGEEETDDEAEGDDANSINGRGQKENVPVPVNASGKVPSARRSGRGKKGGTKDKTVPASRTRIGGNGKGKASAKAATVKAGSDASGPRWEQKEASTKATKATKPSTRPTR